MSAWQQDERPSGAELLKQARDELRAIAASSAARPANDYRARLIAKATVIAARELEQGEAWRNSLAGMLGSLLDERDMQDFARLEAKLAKAIRLGRKNADPATYAYLLAANSPRSELVVGEAKKHHLP